MGIMNNAVFSQLIYKLRITSLLITLHQ